MENTYPPKKVVRRQYFVDNVRYMATVKISETMPFIEQLRHEVFRILNEHNVVVRLAVTGDHRLRIWHGATIYTDAGQVRLMYDSMVPRDKLLLMADESTHW